MAKRNGHPITIDIPTIAPNGVRGRLEKLFREYNTKAQALRIAADIMDEHDRREAMTNAPKKYLAAMNHRAQNGDAAPVDVQVERTYKKRKPKIHGKALTVFLLEGMTEPKTIPELLAALTAAGSPTKKGTAIAGPLACSGRYGYLKKTNDDKWIATSAGVKFAATLRSKLEKRGLIPAGGYFQ